MAVKGEIGFYKRLAPLWTKLCTTPANHVLALTEWLRLRGLPAETAAAGREAAGPLHGPGAAKMENHNLL